MLFNFVANLPISLGNINLGNMKLSKHSPFGTLYSRMDQVKFVEDSLEGDK